MYDPYLTIIWAYLVVLFKQHNITRIFTTLFHLRVFLQYLNNVTRTILSNMSYILQVIDL